MGGDAEFDRIMKLLDIGLEALRTGDGDGAEMALDEALKVAKALPQKPVIIVLPDRTKSGE